MTLTTTDKQSNYDSIIRQLAELFTVTGDPISRMATTAAVLFSQLDYVSWAGFYQLLDGKLIVGPFQGPVACLMLPAGKGVCWAAVNEDRTVIVENVNEFPGHIACDGKSLSEIVVPGRDGGGKVVGVLDLDSYSEGAFDDVDGRGLEEVVRMLSGEC